jgi:hypothetical protein
MVRAALVPSKPWVATAIAAASALPFADGRCPYAIERAVDAITMDFANLVSSIRIQQIAGTQ